MGDEKPSRLSLVKKSMYSWPATYRGIPRNTRELGHAVVQLDRFGQTKLFDLYHLLVGNPENAVRDQEGVARIG